MKKSHIQMPKTVLKEFENKDNGFLYYYSFADYKIHKGHAKTLNTELGYYSDATEDFLSKEIESKLGMLISQLKQMSFKDGEIVPKEYDEVAYSYIYSLISRSATFYKELNKSSVYFKFLNVTSQHDAAEIGYLDASKMGLFRTYKVCLFMNDTEQPMVLPTGGVVQVGALLYSPLTPRRGICFIPFDNESFVKNNNILVKIIDDEIVNIINMMSIRQECERDKGYIVSDRYETISELVTKYMRSIQQGKHH